MAWMFRQGVEVSHCVHASVRQSNFRVPQSLLETRN